MLSNNNSVGITPACAGTTYHAIVDEFNKLGYNKIKVKNSWLDDNNPYKGVNTTVQSPNGQKFEVQYHTSESFALKNGKMHELYEKQRGIKNKHSSEYLALKKEMFELSKSLNIPKDIERIK